MHQHEPRVIFVEQKVRPEGVPSSSYTKDIRNVYYNGEKLDDTNAKTFKLIMNTGYGTDGENVYFQSLKLIDAKAEKFKLENASVGITDQHVYYYGVKLEGIYPDNFTFGNKYYPKYIKNDSVVYYLSTRIKDADAASFEVTGAWGDEAEDKNNRYKEAEIDKRKFVPFGIYKSGVYFANDGSKQLQNADPNTFEIISKYYGKDKNAVYCVNSAVENADGNTFEVIADFVGKDKVAVYHGGSKIVGADPKTYVCLNSRYGKDHKNVFFDEKMIKNVDLPSFKAISNLYSKDKNLVFFQDFIIKNADSKSFEEVIYPFSKDKNSVFYEAVKIENADPASFTTFKETYKDYSKDTLNVYFKTSIVEGADPETFKSFLGSNFWIDKNYVFQERIKMENSDAPTFESLDGMYYQDKNNIYYYYQKMATVYYSK